MKIKVELKKPIDIKPFGSKGKESKHSWYALSDSDFSIEMKSETILEYSDAFASSNRMIGKNVDYYFSRFIDDLLAVVRYLHEPIPTQLECYCNNAITINELLNSVNSWIDKYADDVGDDKFDEIVDSTRGWLFDRMIDMGYLRNSPQIFLVRIDSNVHIIWNSDSVVEDIPVWSSESGKTIISYNDFMIEIERIVNYFLHLMQIQIDDAVKTLSSDLVCGEELDEQHKIKVAQLQDAINSGKDKSLDDDWEQIISAIKEMV